MQSQRNSQVAPVLSIVAFFLAVFSALFAAVFLLVVIATGLTGYSDDAAAIGFFAAAGAMLVFLAASIGLGVKELRRRGHSLRFVRLFLVVAVVGLVAIAVLLAAESRIGGSGVVLLTDLLVVAFVVGLFAWSLAVWLALLRPVRVR